MKQRHKLSEVTKKIVASNQEWKCGFCKQFLPPSYQIDHIVPHSISNSDEYDNLMALCPTCHANKTQSEARRISEYKRMKTYCPESTKLCWFCFETYHSVHTCSGEKQELKTVISEQRDCIRDFQAKMRKFVYVPSVLEEVSLDLKRMNISTEPSTLKIRLYEKLIYVNNYFTSISTYSIEEISNAVFIATRSKSETKKYDKVEVEINIEDIEDDCVDFLDDNLRGKLTKRIFMNPSDVEYIYILNN